MTTRGSEQQCVRCGEKSVMDLGRQQSLERQPWAKWLHATGRSA